ncbi:hypothetical protein PR202_gb07413 [Eleusine coracana subsp. coracana]|uniref:YqgF/RNase H-like domain-containing protein n=1 Tax=Eleusine coracana subsp. coracana TaxID=191504 RepID=A0AAV5EC83_ELECO|nr:hypothetical protein PR202_gb07413 [Eleusine coracana subsp. coracana]
MAMKLAPLMQTGIGTDAGPFHRIPPPRRPSAASSIRSSPSSSFAGAASEFPPPLLSNAQRRVRDLLWHGGGLSLGIDLGDAHTGIAVGRGITLPRPLTVLKLRGQKLELMLLDLARQQEADELIVGLPVSADGSETPQSNKVRSVVGRLAVRAAERCVKFNSAGRRGLRVYLQDEYGTSIDALELMISRGVKKSIRDVKSDAYAAAVRTMRF